MSKHIDQEREAFEAAYLKAYYPGVHCGKLTAPHVFTRVEYPGFQVQHKGDYERSDVQRGWVMWQARAAVQPAGVAVPEGYVLVPIYPTPEMHDAGRKACGGGDVGNHVYTMMLAASPAAPHPVSGERAERPDAVRKRFSDVEDEIMAGKHNAASVFTAMRTAALYIGQPAAQDVSGLMREHRIAVTPEYEGQWHADLYGHESEPLARAGVDTPEAAVHAVIAAHSAQAQGGDV